MGGDYNRVIGNVLEYKRLLGTMGKPSQSIFVQFVESEINAHEVEEFKTFWQQQGIGVKIRPKVSWGGLIEANNLMKLPERKPCYWLMRTINICADGMVAFCSTDVHCRVKCGDINKQTIKEVWNGLLAEYRNLHKTYQFDKLPSVCRDCMDWESTYSETIV